jgi:hypothetical protein
MKLNIPPTSESTENTGLLEDLFFSSTSFPTNDVDAVVGFFAKRGFDDIASKATAMILLSHAKTENTEVFRILDTLKGLSNIQLSMMVTEILNNNRARCSTLGYKRQTLVEDFERRNIFI